MIRSMTGYGQASATCAGLRVTVELRSVNNRYADVRLKLPPELAKREGKLRRRVLKDVHRGRVDLTLNLERTGERRQQLTINRSLARTLTAAAHELREEFGVNGRLDLATLLTIPGILEVEEQPAEWGEEEQAALEQALEGALQALDSERHREGQDIRRDLVRRIGVMEKLAGSIEERAGELPSTVRQKLLDRLEALTQGVEIDPSRVAQEAAFLADRADVTEEVVRLKGHLAQARSLLAEPDGGPVGKRLDFLLQEINRETNTVNGKSADLELSRHALELKAEAEKVREQVQNLE